MRVSEREYGAVAMLAGPAGEIHAAAGAADDWAPQEGGGIFYLTNAGGTWTETRVSTSPSGGADLQPTIALLADGSIAIAFTRYGRVRCEFGCSLGRNRGIHLVNNSAGDWSQPAAVSAAGSHSPQLASAGGWLHLLYETFGQVPRFFYARGPGIQLAPAYSVEATSARLAVDASGTGYLAYVATAAEGYTGPAPVLFWSLPLGGDSESETAAEMDGSIAVELLAFAPEDYPSIFLTVHDWSAYPHYRTDYVLSWASDGWNDPQQLPELVASVALDGAGTWHGLQDVSSSDDGYIPVLTERDGLWYVTDRTGHVVRERIDASVREVILADAGEWAASALTLDGAGRPHVLLTRLIEQDDSNYPTRDGLWYTVGPGS